MPGRVQQLIRDIRRRFRHKILVGLSLGAVLFCFTGAAAATDLNAQIAALKAEAAAQQAQAAQLQGTANDYQSRVNQLQLQIAALQTQIALNQAQYNQVSAAIADNEAKLADAKTALGADLKSMYVSSSETPLEMLVSSNNLSDYFNQQQYQDSIKDKIQGAVTTILKLQDELHSQQQSIAGILSSLHSQQQQLNASRAEAQALLNTAQQNVAAANQQVRSTNSELAQKQAEQAALLAASSSSFNGTIPGASSGSGGACDNGHGNGGYPMLWCNAYQDSIQTPSGYNRECVSWAGWRWHQFGHPMVNWGNANTWDDNARAAGYTVNSSPAVGAIAQTNAGPFGHVAIVEAVMGGNVVVSEMNYDSNGHYRLGSYPSGYFQYIH